MGIQFWLVTKTISHVCVTMDAAQVIGMIGRGKHLSLLKLASAAADSHVKENTHTQSNRKGGDGKVAPLLVQDTKLACRFYLDCINHGI